jgi:hypothetical protein
MNCSEIRWLQKWKRQKDIENEDKVGEQEGNIERARRKGRGIFG